MNINIDILNVSKTTATSKTGKPYSVYEVAYKQDGQVKGKKLLEFKAKDVCKALANANAGDRFTIVQEKEGDYWEWKSVETGGSASTTTAAPAGNATTQSTGAVKTTPKGDWETKEERAAKQVMIVKQSSLAQAVASLKLDKAAVDDKTVLELAQKYTDWVLAKPELPVVEKAGNDLTDDIPF